MRKRVLPSMAAVAVLMAACSCPSSFREVPAPGSVTTLSQVAGLSRCQIKLYGTTLLGLANHPDIIRALLDRGAEPNGTLIIGGKEYRGSACHLVTNPAVVGQLAAAGGNMNMQGWPDNDVPLHQAIRTGRTELALQLLTAGADPNKVDSHNQTPLYLAASRLDVPLCRALLGRGARPDAGDYTDGTTPLLAALKVGGGPEVSVQAKLAVAELLLGAGADPIMPDNQGDRPMHYAPLELMPALQAVGASVNCANDRGRTPMFMGGGRKRLEYLLQSGANVNATDTEGLTPFDVIKDPDLRTFILSNGGHSGKRY